MVYLCGRSLSVEVPEVETEKLSSNQVPAAKDFR